MNVGVEKTSPGERVLTVTVPANQVEKAYRQAFQERRKTLRLKGFRKGNVPEKIAKRHITDAHLLSRVVNLLVPSAYKEAVKNAGIQPLGKPEWKLKQSDRGSDLIFEANVQVMPLLELDSYRGMKIERPAVKVDEERLEQILDHRRQGVARYVDRPAKHKAVLGDFCSIDYSASQNGEPLPHAQVSDFLLEMRQEKFLPGFVDNLVGVKAGQEIEFPLRLSKDYAQHHLAGAEVLFRVKIHQIKKREVPALDDNFAKSHCQAGSLEELYARIRRNLLAQERSKQENEIVHEIVSRLASQIDPGIVPSHLREGHARLALRTQTQSLERQGLTLEKWLAERGQSMEQFTNELNLTGLVEARLEILYRSLAAAEDIAVSNKEVDQAIVAQANSNKSSAKEMKIRMLKDDTYKLLAYRLLIGKIRKRLLELADITYTDTEKAASKAQAAKSAERVSKKKTSAKQKKKAKKTKSASKKKKSRSKKTKSKAKSIKKKKTPSKKSI